ncbi:DUF2795 domain-containing protein [Caballeronia sp. LZ034LL]|uniref:DUF2795 domain-containing protein n=1 Tax=Caballeronia sp. LZ034LL TaxID=3038567 RepID=UPI0028654F95|nr:DUF2795 domain-containing protein [Caballeronia sp. LZ034LL]MDR5835945.1 DUF2795 domain-containing protein [Caballeronia sp. LZ034LL]
MTTQNAGGGSNSVFIELQKALKGIDYPANRQTIIETARKHNAGDAVMSALEKLPDQDFQTPAEVSKAVGAEG